MGQCLFLLCSHKGNKIFSGVLDSREREGEDWPSVMQTNWMLRVEQALARELFSEPNIAMPPCPIISSPHPGCPLRGPGKSRLFPYTQTLPCSQISNLNQETEPQWGRECSKPSPPAPNSSCLREASSVTVSSTCDKLTLASTSLGGILVTENNQKGVFWSTLFKAFERFLN